LVYMDYKYRRRKIRFSNYLFNNINGLRKSEIFYYRETQLYYPNDKYDIRNVAVIKLKAGRINHSSILTAIGNIDFYPRPPRLDNKYFFTSKEVFFINIDKKIILQMYDDRGLEIISADKETLRPIYKQHNEWILEYDRELIDKQFE